MLRRIIGIRHKRMVQTMRKTYCQFLTINIIVFAFCFFSTIAKSTDEQNERPKETVVKHKIDESLKYITHTFNTGSLFGDSINENDLLQATGKTFIRENDTRQEVITTKKHPYQNIGLLTSYDDSEEAYGYGTASKISDKYILTAAHNLVECLSYDQKKIYKKPTYFSGFSNGEYFDSSSVEKIYVPDDYCKKDNDWAVAKLKKNVKPDTYLSFATLSEESMKNKPVRVIGYSSDLIKGKSKNPIMFEDTGEILNFTKNRFSHDANTYKGNSGGPVIFEQGIDITQKQKKIIENPIVGIHVAGADPKIDNDKNHATMITEDIYSKIEQIVDGKSPKGMDEIYIGEENEQK